MPFSFWCVPFERDCAEREGGGARAGWAKTNKRHPSGPIHITHIDLFSEFANAFVCARCLFHLHTFMKRKIFKRQKSIEALVFNNKFQHNLPSYAPVYMCNVEQNSSQLADADLMYFRFAYQTGATIYNYHQNKNAICCANTHTHWLHNAHMLWAMFQIIVRCSIIAYC